MQKQKAENLKTVAKSGASFTEAVLQLGYT